MKGYTLGYIKAVQNGPECKATVDMKAGMGVILDREAKTASLPGENAADCVYIVSNICDKPEIHDSGLAHVAKAGEYVRVDYLRNVDGLVIEFSADEITGGTADLAAGDTLVFGADGMLVKNNSATDYAAYFKVIKHTAYNGDGIRAEIICH